MKSPVHLDNILNGLLIAVMAALLIGTHADRPSREGSVAAKHATAVTVTATAAAATQTLAPLRN